MLRIHQQQQIDSAEKQYKDDAFLRFVDESCISFQSEMKSILLKPIDVFIEAMHIIEYVLQEGERTCVDALWHREYNNLRELVEDGDDEELKKANCIILTIAGIMGTTSKWSYYNSELFILILQSLNEEYPRANSIYNRILEVAEDYTDSLYGWMDKFLPNTKSYPRISDACRRFFAPTYRVHLAEENSWMTKPFPVEQLMHNIYDHCNTWTPTDPSSKRKWKALYSILKTKRYIIVGEREKYSDFVKYIVEYCFEEIPQKYNDSISKSSAPSQISEIEDAEEKALFKQIFDFA